MGTRGPIGQSADELKRHGTYRKDRHSNRGRGIPGGGLTFDPAEHVPERYAPLVGTGAGLGFWKSMLPILHRAKFVRDSDLMMFSVLCHIVHDMEINREQFGREGIMLTGSRGRLYEHPAHKQFCRLAKQYAALADKYGLTPTSRRRLGLEIPELDAANDGDAQDFGIPTRDRTPNMRDRLLAARNRDSLIVE